MKSTLIKGTFGTTIPIFAAVSMPAVEAWMRIASLGIGIAVGLATLVSIVRKMFKQ